MRYGVIGAGALGLTVALRLVQRGHDVTILERDTVPGGLAGSFEVAPGIWLEKFYHHLFKTDRSAVALIEEVGLGEALAGTDRRRPCSSAIMPTRSTRRGRLWGSVPWPFRIDFAWRQASVISGSFPRPVGSRSRRPAAGCDG